MFLYVCVWLYKLLMIGLVYIEAANQAGKAR